MFPDGSRDDQTPPRDAGRCLVGPDIEALLAAAGVRRETMTRHPGLQSIRRRHDDGHLYFLVNDGQDAVEGWVEFAAPFRSASVMDAMTGDMGIAACRHVAGQPSQVFLQLAPGASLFVRTFEGQAASGPAWRYRQPAGEPFPLTGRWRIDFLEGGPELPPSVETDALGSWTDLGAGDAERFAGTARYQILFDAPPVAADEWWLDLGRVCESARVRLNGDPVGTAIASPFRLRLGTLKPTGNTLEVEVTNLAANRIRDMDRRGLTWRIFHEINFVNKAYKPFDAAEWPVRPSGLLGPVRLLPMGVLPLNSSGV